MRMLDLFCGRGGWTNAFLERGWECVGIDINPQPDYRGEFIQDDVLSVTAKFVQGFDFACASSPCEEFSVYGMRHFHPNPKFPDMGLALFCWTRRLLDNAKVPYVMENVRPAERFVGRAAHHCGPFYVWGNGVPVLMAQGIKKGLDMGSSAYAKGLRGKELHDYRRQFTDMWAGSNSPQRKKATARVAMIPPELANCVAEYAERICK
jgi:hypothetical protein